MDVDVIDRANAVTNLSAVQNIYSMLERGVEEKVIPYQQHMEFVEWAKSYDNGGLDIRSKAMHDELEKKFQCRVLHLDGGDDLEDKFEKVLKALDRKK